MNIDYVSFGLGAVLIALVYLIAEAVKIIKTKGFKFSKRKNLTCPVCDSDSFIPMAQKKGFYWCFKCGEERRIGGEEVIVQVPTPQPIPQPIIEVPEQPARKIIHRKKKKAKPIKEDKAEEKKESPFDVVIPEESP